MKIFNYYVSAYARKRESIWPFKVNVDFRFCGNDGLALGY